MDLARRSTPAEGGFCAFRPVVDDGACPWNPDCHNCDKFVLSGADLLYWRRKREQWRQLFEGAPDDATLKQRVRQLSTDNRTLEERFKAALSSLRFQDRRIADLEARIADPTFHSDQLGLTP